MFWRYHTLTSHIDTLLENESVTLHELMDEDDILQECKGQNLKLIEFLVTPDVMEQLVELITCEPGEDVDDKVKYKYPNIACELLTSDVTQILDKLVEDNVLIDKVYAFLLSGGELNPLLASFFTKVLGLLLARKSEFLLEYLKAKDGFLHHLLCHLGTSAIMDLLMRLVTCDIFETKPKIMQWMDDENLIEKLIDLIHPSQPEEMHCNAATSLCDIIRSGREQLGVEVPIPDPLLDKIENDLVLTKLLDNMLDGEHQESVVTNTLLILQTILEYRRQLSSFDDWRPLSETCTEQLPQIEIERMDKAIASVLQAVKPRLGELAKMLVNPPQSSFPKMETTVGVLEPPLGNMRLQIARLFATLFSINDSDLHLCLIEHDVVNKLLDLFFQYVWNNFLHTQVEISICNILTKRGVTDESPLTLDEQEIPQTTETTDAENPLVTHLFKDCKMVDRLINAWRLNDELVNDGKQRRGYMGHVTKICNDLVSAKDKGPYSSLISTLYQEIPEETSKLWDDLVETKLAETNKRNMADLVGAHPLNSSSGSDSDSDFRDIPFPQDDTLQQAFSDYQMQQLTSNFIDQFGLNDEEFGEPASRIDAAFTQQLSSLVWTTNTTEETPKQYEAACEAEPDVDSGDEDDLWKDKEIKFQSPSNVNGNTTISNATMADSDSDESSSEDELTSVPVIKSRPDPSMEVDPHPDIIEVPVAMDTSPWETAPTKTGGDDEGWTAFESAEKDDSDDSNSGWADFSNIDQGPAEDGGPRVSSPDALVDSSSSANTYNSSQPSTIFSNNLNDENLKTSNSPSAGTTRPDTCEQFDSSSDESLEQSPLSDEEHSSNNTLQESSELQTKNTEEQSIAKPADGTVKMEVDELKSTDDSTSETNQRSSPSNPPTESPTETSDSAASGDSHKTQKVVPEINGPVAEQSLKDPDDAAANGPH